ncbi:MAG TPA: GNAT family N-acetyltransferase [Trebonia sp.]|jgi:ribosomal protein S18 acetylase RimI-like enzyme|nr:GNAT family N-acetyltransferase [Trebonia sp.]
MNADRFAAAMTDTVSQLSTSIPGSRVLRKEGAAAWITGIPYPSFNGVLLERPNPPATAVAALLDEAADAGVPFTFSLRPGSDAALADLAAARGMKPGGQLPLMVFDATAGVGPVRQAEGLTIRQLQPEEVPVHARVAAAGFGGPEEMFVPTPDLLRIDGVRGYVGEAEGRAVATTLGVTVGEFTGIYSVATDPAFRCRGFGTALAARAVVDGVRAGASWCWLQASDDGYPVYRKLGFATIETWTRWMSGA